MTTPGTTHPKVMTARRRRQLLADDPRPYFDRALACNAKEYVLLKDLGGQLAALTAALEAGTATPAAAAALEAAVAAERAGSAALEAFSEEPGTKLVDLEAAEGAGPWRDAYAKLSADELVYLDAKLAADAAAWLAELDAAWLAAYAAGLAGAADAETERKRAEALMTATAPTVAEVVG